MARVLMIGYGPLPQKGLTLFMAPSLRTRHLLHGVKAGGHEVHLFTLPLPGTEGEEGAQWRVIPDEYEGMPFHRFSNHSGEFAITQLAERLGEIDPDAIVGVNTYPSYVAAMLPSTAPLWADLNGYWMAEIQARCNAEQDDRRLLGGWAIERAILRRLDKFSAVSRPQLHAVLGEMATVGRLNRHTFSYPFGSHLPNAAHRWEETSAEGGAEEEATAGGVVVGAAEPEVRAEMEESGAVEAEPAANGEAAKSEGGAAGEGESEQFELAGEKHGQDESPAQGEVEGAAQAEGEGEGELKEEAAGEEGAGGEAVGPEAAAMKTESNSAEEAERKSAAEEMERVAAEVSGAAATASGAEVGAARGAKAKGRVLRGPVVPESAFIVLWSGGFNLWTDIDTMVAAVDELMKRNPQVHFVTTGGQLDGVDTTTYKQFIDHVAQSPYKERYHPLGWVESEKLPAIYREADVGLNVDGANYETMFGARNRINAMAAEGLAVATTIGTEISEWLEDAEAVLPWQMGDPDSLVDAIEPWIDQAEHLRVLSERAQRVMETDFSYEATTAKLRRWLEDPQLAPDNEAKIRQSGGELADLNAVTGNPLEAQSVLLDQYDSRSLLESVREIETLRNRRWFQMYKRVSKIVKE